MDTDQFLLFGDSITQQSFSQDRGFSFGAALSNAYVRRLDVVNRGLSGYNTRQALQVLSRVVPSPGNAKLRFISIGFGANDARLPGTLGGPQQHVPLEEYRGNLKAIVSHAAVKAQKGVRLILITPPPVDERKCLEDDELYDPRPGPQTYAIRRKASVTAQYARTVCEVGKELNIAVLDLWSAMIVRSGGSVDEPEPIGSIYKPQNETLQSFVHDGLHLTAGGYGVMYEEMMALIARVWPDQTPEKLPFVLPSWEDRRAWHAQTSL